MQTEDLRFTPNLLRRPIPHGLAVETTLHHMVSVTYAIRSDRGAYRLRCKGRAVRVLWDGKEGELVVERADSRKAPYHWQSVASWASKTGDVLSAEVLETVERAAG